MSDYKIAVYTEYIVENLQKTKDYSNNLADQIDNSIDYSEYLAEAMYNPERDRIKKQKLRKQKMENINNKYGK